MRLRCLARFTQSLAAWQDRVREPSLTALLVGQVVLLFLVSPLSSLHTIPYVVVNAMQVLLVLVSYLALPAGSRVRPFLLGCVLLLLGTMAETGPTASRALGLVLRMASTLGITVAVGQAVLRAPRISSHQLLGAVVVYLNLALLFMGAFIGLSEAVPGAFANPTHDHPHPGELLYFSLTTLTSTGYGDVLPVHPLARSLANLEAVIGQLFLAILLARLVGLQAGPPRGD